MANTKANAETLALVMSKCQARRDGLRGDGAGVGGESTLEMLDRLRNGKAQKANKKGKNRKKKRR